MLLKKQTSGPGTLVPPFHPALYTDYKVKEVIDGGGSTWGRWLCVKREVYVPV